jgi:phage repressor protein C with HTH and peptisase S24 domain
VIATRGREPERLKVLGMAECGPDGWSLWNGDVIDMIERPASLNGVASAYAVYVVGASMEPRYHPGEVVHIHPGKPVSVGSYVLVQRRAKGGETPLAVIKRLVKRTPAKITLEQFNPHRVFDIKAADIVSVHRVVGSGET